MLASRWVAVRRISPREQALLRMTPTADARTVVLDTVRAPIAGSPGGQWACLLWSWRTVVRSLRSEKAVPSRAPGRGLLRGYSETMPCGSMTYLRAAPLSNSAYPCGAWSSGITVALTFRAIWTRSCRIAIMSWRW